MATGDTLASKPGHQVLVESEGRDMGVSKAHHGSAELLDSCGEAWRSASPGEASHGGFSTGVEEEQGWLRLRKVRACDRGCRG